MLPTVVLLLFCGAVNAIVHGVDSSTLVSRATYSKALGEGFTKAIIRGYHEACAIGGQVDPYFVASYNNARAAGFTNIDTYWFPCTGSGNPCKAFSVQISELARTFKEHSIQIGRIWVDIEKDNVCNNWNYGVNGNLAQAHLMVSALRASGFAFGIYSSPGEWGTVFGSRSTVLANDVPLWFATYDNVEDLQMRTPFGGWTSAYGKQYTDKSASGQFDLNVFSA